MLQECKHKHDLLDDFLQITYFHLVQGCLHEMANEKFPRKLEHVQNFENMYIIKTKVYSCTGMYSSKSSQ